MVGDGSELTPAEVAKEFNVSPATVRRWGARGWLKPTRRLPGSTYRRYSRADIDAFKERMEAGEYDDIAVPAANRTRKSKPASADTADQVEPHDAAPEMDGARRLP